MATLVIGLVAIEWDGDELVDCGTRFVLPRRAPFVATDAAQPLQLDKRAADARQRDGAVLRGTRRASRRANKINWRVRHERSAARTIVLTTLVSHMKVRTGMTEPCVRLPHSEPGSRVTKKPGERGPSIRQEHPSATVSGCT